MRTLIVILACTLVLPLLIASPVSAAPVCQTLERSVATAAGPTTARTDSCTEAASGSGWSYQRWWNATRVTGSVAATGATYQVYMESYHTMYTSGSYSYEYREHYYGARTTDWDDPVAQYTYVDASNGQSQSSSGCYKSTGASVGQGGPNGGGYAYRSLNGGSASPYIIPCTSSDVQQSLP